MRRPTAPFLSLFTLAACAACAGVDDTDERVVVGDSAGVRVVQSAVPVFSGAETLRLSAEPEITIGVVDGPAAYQFDLLRGVRLREDGGVVASDRSLQIRYFDGAGQHVRSVGGSGSGPGEYRSALIQAFAGDSLLVFDMQQRRLTVLDAEGRTVSTHPSLPVRFPSMRAALPGAGAVFDMNEQPDGWPLGVVEGMRSVLVQWPDRPDPDTLWAVRAPVWIGIEQGGSRSLVAPPFMRSISVAASGDRLIVGTGETARVEVVDASGRIVARYGWAEELRPVTTAMREAHVEQAMLGPAGGASESERRRNLESLPFPDHLLVFDRLLADRGNGRIWIHRFIHDGEEVPWTVLEADGRWLGDVSLPPGFSPMDILDDRVAGGWWDDMRVPFVHVYRLEEF